jgi:hypothetical protein
MGWLAFLFLLIADLGTGVTSRGSGGLRPVVVCGGGGDCDGGGGDSGGGGGDGGDGDGRGDGAGGDSRGGGDGDRRGGDCGGGGGGGGVGVSSRRVRCLGCSLGCAIGNRKGGKLVRNGGRVC